MGPLTEFLKDKAARLKESEPERRRLVEDWQDAVDRLMNQLKEWLREADPDQVLKVQNTTHRFNDERMGSYAVSGLKIELDGQTISITPVARLVVASVTPPGASEPIPADGRVDVKKGGGTFYALYRVRNHDSDTWHIVQPGVWDIRRKQDYAAPLTREEFERSLLSLFE